MHVTARQEKWQSWHLDYSWTRTVEVTRLRVKMADDPKLPRVQIIAFGQATRAENMSRSSLVG
jgi:hypothetical protein